MKVNSTKDIKAQLIDYIENKSPDLVVTASHSSEKGFLFGSVSSYIAKEASMDVLIFV